MPIGEDELRRILLKIGSQPLLFWRSLLTSAHIGALAVESDNMPCAQIEAVITTAWLSGGFAEVVEVTCRSRCVIFVVAHGGAGAGSVPSPGPGVAVAEVRAAAVGINRVAKRQNGSRYLVQ